MTDMTALIERRDYALGRVENAKRLGKPGHIARCRERYEGLAMRVSVLEQRND